MDVLKDARQYIGDGLKRILGIDPDKPIYFNSLETRTTHSSFPSVHAEVVRYNDALIAQGFKPPHQKRTCISGISKIVSKDGAQVLKPSHIGFMDTEISEISHMLAEGAVLDITGNWYSFEGYAIRDGVANGHPAVPLVAKLQIHRPFQDPGTVFDSVWARLGYKQMPLKVNLIVETPGYTRVSPRDFNEAVAGLKEELALK